MNLERYQKMFPGETIATLDIDSLVERESNKHGLDINLVKSEEKKKTSFDERYKRLFSVESPDIPPSKPIETPLEAEPATTTAVELETPVEPKTAELGEIFTSTDKPKIDPVVPEIEPAPASTTRVELEPPVEPKAESLEEVFTSTEKTEPESVVPDVEPSPASTTGVRLEPLEEPKEIKPEIKQWKTTGTGEAMIRSAAAGAGELGLSIARIPQTGAEIFLGLNNLLNKGVSKSIELATAGKKKDTFPSVSHEVIPEFLKLKEDAWDTKAVKQFIKNQKEVVKEATNEKGVVDNLAKGNFAEAGKSLAIQAAAQIPLVASMMVGGLAGAGAKTLGAIAGVSTASQQMDEYWEKVDKGITKQSFEVATANALVNGFIEAFGESLGTGKIVSDAVGLLSKAGKKEVAQKTIGNTVGNYIGKVLGSSGQEATEETIVGYSQAVSDKIFGGRPEVTFTKAVKEGIESGLVGFVTSAGTTGQLAGVAEVVSAKETGADVPIVEEQEVTKEEAELAKRVKEEQKDVPLKEEPQEEITPEIKKSFEKATAAKEKHEKALKIEKKMKDPEIGVSEEVEKLKAIKEDFQSTGLPETKKSFQSYWESVSGEKLSREDAGEKLKQVIGSTEEDFRKPIEEAVKEEISKPVEKKPKEPVAEKPEGKEVPQEKPEKKQEKSSVREKVRPGTIQTYDKSVKNAFEKKDEKSIGYLSSVVLRKNNTNLRKIFEEENDVKLPETGVKKFLTNFIQKGQKEKNIEESNYQRRYVYYSESQGKTSEEQQKTDKDNSKYINWINDKWSQYDNKHETKGKPRTIEIQQDFDNWLRDETMAKKLGDKPNNIKPSEALPDVKPEGGKSYSIAFVDDKKEKKTNEHQTAESVVHTAKTSLAEPKDKTKQIKAVKEIEGQIQRNPGGEKKGSGWLTPFEYGYFKVKEIATPIFKIGDEIVKHVKDETIRTELVQSVDRARGSGSISQQYIKDNYEPIFKPLKKKSPKEQGQIARYLSDYIIGKRSVHLYENKKGYKDAGISKETAKTIVDYIENGDNQYSDLILSTAQQLWDYNKKLLEIKYKSGIIDKDLLDNLKEPYYVPFNRDVESGKPITPGKQKFTAVSTNIRRIKGSETGHKIIDPIQLMIAHTNETIVNSTRVEVAQGVVKAAEKHPEIFEGLIEKLPPKWVRAGMIEHRTEVDKLLKENIEKFSKKIGIDIKTGYKLGKKRLGHFNEFDQEIKVLYGATEGTTAHELGHAIDSKFKWVRGFLTQKRLEAEINLVADSRYEGQGVDNKFVRYVRQQDEKVAEFISLYLTDRPFLKQIAPVAYGEFEQRLVKDEKLKELKDIKPSNVSAMEKYYENNYVMDNSIPPDEDVISLRRGGVLEHYRVPIELAQAIKNLHPNQIPTLLKWTVAIPTRALRFGAVTGNPDFFIPNIGRDQFDAAFNTKNIPFVDWFIGAKAYFGITEDGKKLFDLYNRMGGGMDSPEAGVAGHKSAYSNVIYGSKAAQFLDPFYWKSNGVLKGTADLTWYGVKFPFDIVSRLCELSEMGTRLGVFSRNLNAMKKAGIDIKNLESKDSQMAIGEAVHAARQSTLDFQRFGYSGKIPNEIIPFINATLEGLDRFARSWAVPIKKGKIPLRPIIFTGAMYGIYAGLTAWNREEEEYYKKIPSQEKANNWIIMKGEGDGSYWKVPKGHITKLVLNPGQMLYEKMEGLAEKTGWGLAVDMFMEVSPIDQGNILPVIGKLIVEPQTNYNWYWKEQIEKPIYKSLPAGYRFKKSTSETLKTIGKALNISPMMMQNSVNTALSGTGRNLLWLTDWALGHTGLQKPPHFDADKAIILRRFNGQVEDWKSDSAYMLKIVNQRIREIKSAGKGARVRRLRSIGFTAKEIQEVIGKSRDELVDLQRKKRELERASGELDTLYKSTLRK